VERIGDVNDPERLHNAAFKTTSIVVEGHFGNRAPDKQKIRVTRGESLGEREVGLAKPRDGRRQDGKFRVSPGSEHVAAGVGRQAKRRVLAGAVRCLPRQV
jgi:hypothetical protein